jgi:hypothetical protein
MVNYAGATLHEDEHAVAVIVLFDDDLVLLNADEVEEFEEIVEFFVGEFHEEGFASEFVPGFAAGAHGWVRVWVDVGRDD